MQLRMSTIPLFKKKKLKPNGNAVEPLFGFLEVWDTEPNKVSIFKDYII